MHRKEIVSALCHDYVANPESMALTNEAPGNITFNHTIVTSGNTPKFSEWEESVCNISNRTWCRHQMETFSALLAICAGHSPVTGEFSTQRPVTRSFDIFFDLRINERLSKQSRGWWFQTPSRPLWRHSYVIREGWLKILRCLWDTD